MVADARVSRSGEPAIRRGKNALPADDLWHTFIFRAACGALARRYASSAFLLHHRSRRLEGSPLLDTRAPGDAGGTAKAVPYLRAHEGARSRMIDAGTLHVSSTIQSATSDSVRKSSCHQT